MEVCKGLNTLSIMCILLNVYTQATREKAERRNVSIINKLLHSIGCRHKDWCLSHGKHSQFYESLVPSSNHLCGGFSSNMEKEQTRSQSAESRQLKANGSDSSLPRVINKRDAITNSSNGNINISSQNGPLTIVPSYAAEVTSERPCYIGLCLSNYGNQVPNPDPSQLTALHIGMLMLAITGAAILLLINFVGIFFCVRYFTRRNEINSLADDSFKSISSSRKKWSLQQRRITLERDTESLQFPFSRESSEKNSPTERETQIVPNCPLLPRSSSNKENKTWL